ncbi:MAG: hypothetical protein QXP57_09140 [Nitrososphaerota archaeon]
MRIPANLRNKKNFSLSLIIIILLMLSSMLIPSYQASNYAGSGETVLVTSTITSTKTLTTTITSTVSMPVFTVTSTITQVIPTKITSYSITTSKSYVHTRVTTTSYCIETLSTTTTKTVYTTVTVTTTVSKPSPQYEFRYIEEEESIPKGTQRSFSISGAGRALIIKVEAVDRLFLLGAFIRNKYSITVYRDGQQITTLNPEVSRIDPPGDPIIYELVVEPKSTYRIVVKTEDIGCVPLFGWPCNGDRVRVQILLGLYTTKWAEEMYSAYKKAAQLWTNPGAQFIADILGYIGGKPELESLAKMSLYYVIDLVGYSVFGVSGLSNVIEAWEKALIDTSNAAEKGAMTADWPFRIYPCIREWPEDVPDCIGPSSLSLEDRHRLRQQLKEFYETVGYPYTQYSAGFGTPIYPPQWDYIKMQLGFMAWNTYNIYYALKNQNYGEALNHMQYNQKFRQHLEWIASFSSDDLALYQPWKGMYDHTRMIVMLDLKS